MICQMKTNKHQYKGVGLVLTSLLICSSCNTYHVHVVNHKHVEACRIDKHVRPVSKYQKLDSLFQIASKEAMERALELTTPRIQFSLND